MAKETPARTIATVTIIEGDEVHFDSVPVNATEINGIVEEVCAAIYQPDETDTDKPEHVSAAWVGGKRHGHNPTIAAIVTWYRGEDWRMFIELEPNT